MSILGDRIKLRRTEAGLTLAELARRVGISKGYLHSIERGDTKHPSAEILFNIANVLDTTIADLLGEDEPLPAVEISKELRDFADKENLTDADIEMLARVRYRGKTPKTIEDWRFIFEAIKRTLK